MSINCDESNQINDFSDIPKIINKYDELLKTVQNEVEFYKKEHNLLRNEIITVIDDNKKLTIKIKNDNEKLFNYYSEDDKEITINAIDNLREQIKLLNEEKHTIEILWKTSQKTIENLEFEIREYRKLITQPNTLQEIKNKFDSAIRILEEKITQLKNELKNQLTLNKQLSDNKIDIEKKLNDLNDKYQNIMTENKTLLEKLENTEKSLNLSRQQIHELQLIKLSLEENLEKSKIIAKENIRRETEALNKVSEALLVAENALQEKERAILKEKAIKEECDYLANTIGQVMEEAAKKVENDMENMKRYYIEKIKKLEGLIEQMKMNADLQLKEQNCLLMKIKTLEDKLKEVLNNNASLDSDLHIASQAIIEMELKLETFERIIGQEQETNKLTNEKTAELENFLETNKKIKIQWKNIINDITLKLENEIKCLQNENRQLLIDNKILQKNMNK